MMQLMHDIANITQKMISLSYEYELNGLVLGKLNEQLTRSSYTLKIYSGIYMQSSHNFEEIVEMIQILNGHSVELTSYNPHPSLSRLLLVYCMWITKHHDLNICLNEDAVEAVLSIVGENSNQIGAYFLGPDDLGETYPNLIKDLLKDHKLKVTEEAGRIVISSIDG